MTNHTQPSQQVPTQEQWQSLAACMYQAAGAFDLPVRFLDALSAAQSGEPFAHLLDGLLPVVSQQVPVAISDEEIVRIATKAVADGKLNWLGFDKDENDRYTIPSLSQSDFKLVRAVLEAVFIAPDAGLAEDAIQIADAERLRLAEMYQDRVNSGTSHMGGNMDWARLEGAVSVVQALRNAALASQEPQHG